MSCPSWLSVAGVALLATVALYDRSDWPHWSAGDTWGDRLDVRGEVLVERSLSEPEIECGLWSCRVVSGSWVDELAGEVISGSADQVEIDHVVPLAEAHRSGASCWSRSMRREFANDKAGLAVTKASTNREKGDGDLAQWLPAGPTRCAYVERYMRGKERWGLLYDAREGWVTWKLAIDCEKGS